MSKIFPRNLTARAAYLVAGNPPSTRLESGVGNCYPGLEFDHRNLERRLLPGLVVEFVQADIPARANLQGARLVGGGVDLRDPGLTPGPKATPDEQQALQQLRQELVANADTLSQGDWFLLAITQSGRRLEFLVPDSKGQKVPMDGMVVWRLVRCLEPAAVTVELACRAMPEGQPLPLPVVLHGWRRPYTDPETGVISAAYRPGELSQSLCSPWQHDFRDCGCTYWASNHPDVVMVEDRMGEKLLPSGASADPRRALTRVRWLRSDRDPDRSSEARETFALNRPEEMDHYEINQRWQELSVVLGDKEVGSVYRPHAADTASPFANAVQMADHITFLATLEHVLTLEYLYAYYSVRLPSEVPEGPQAAVLREDVVFIRHFVLLVAINEMQHLRWANQLLWELKAHGLIDPATYGPSLGVSPTVPVSDGGKERPRALRTLTPDVLMDFIAVERPSGLIEGQYARVVATLRQRDKGYPDSLFQLASRVVNEGTEHFNHFHDIRLVMRQYGGTPYLRDVQKGDLSDPQVKEAVELYTKIVEELKTAYATGSVADRPHITAARMAMTKLYDLGETLAARGLGIPFF